MDVDSAFISKIVDTGRVEEMTSAGFGAEMFGNEQAREAFIFINDYVHRYKQAPSKQAVQDNNPNFDFQHVTDSLDYVRDKFVARVQKRASQEIMLDLADAIDDPERSKDLVGEFLSASRDLATLVPTNDVAFFSDSINRKEEYEKEAAAGVNKGIPFGYRTLDGMTGGVKPHEFVVVSAFLGLGKSTALNSFAYNMYGLPDDVSIMMITLELEKKALMNKFDAMAAGINYRKIDQLGLTEEEVEAWNETAKNIRNKRKSSKNDILVIDRMMNATPDKVFAETIKHKPDVVFVDYVGLMKSSSASRASSQWQAMGEITQDLKQNARILGVPIIAAAQTNRSAAKEGSELDNIGGSIAIAQDADIVVGLHADDEMKEQKQMQFRVQKNRRGPLGPFMVTWDHENNYFGEGEGPKTAGGLRKATVDRFPAKKSRPTKEDDEAPSREFKPKRPRPAFKPSEETVKASNKEVNERLNAEEDRKSGVKYDPVKASQGKDPWDPPKKKKRPRPGS